MPTTLGQVPTKGYVLSRTEKDVKLMGLNSWRCGSAQIVYWCERDIDQSAQERSCQNRSDIYNNLTCNHCSNYKSCWSENGDFMRLQDLCWTQNCSEQLTHRMPRCKLATAKNETWCQGLCNEGSKFLNQPTRQSVPKLLGLWLHVHWFGILSLSISKKKQSLMFIVSWVRTPDGQWSPAIWWPPQQRVTPQVNASAADDILIMCSAETDGSSDHEAGPLRPETCGLCTEKVDWSHLRPFVTT